MTASFSSRTSCFSANTDSSFALAGRDSASSRAARRRAASRRPRTCRPAARARRRRGRSSRCAGSGRAAARVRPAGAGAVGEHPAQEILVEGEFGMRFEVLRRAAVALGADSSARAGRATRLPSRSRRRWRARPTSTAIQPYFSAVAPDRHTPAVATTSHTGEPSSPCTMTAWLGMSWSGFEVPHTRQAMSSRAKPSLDQAPDGRSGEAGVGVCRLGRWPDR